VTAGKISKIKKLSLHRVYFYQNSFEILLHEKLEILYANNIDILVVHFILDEC